MATAPVGDRLAALPALELDKAYPMNLEHLGHAVVVNNMMSEFPQSAEDVASVLKSVGFTVKPYNNCNEEEMSKIKDYITTESLHVTSNSFILVVLCHQIEKGWLLDGNHKRALNIEELTTSLSKVRTLRGKPKVLLIQESNNGSDDDIEQMPNLKDKEDFYIVCATSDGESESSYLQEFAKKLKEHYMQETLREIFWTTKQSLQDHQISPDLENDELMVLAGKISAEAMRIIAVQKLGIEYDQVKSLSEANHENQHIMKFEILRKWKNMNQGATRQKLADNFRNTDGLVDSKMVDKVLKTGEMRAQGIKQFDNFKHTLYISEFYEKKHTVAETCRYVTLAQILTHDTNLRSYAMCGFTVMPSTGQIVVVGHEKTWVSTTEYCLYVYTPTGEGLKHRTVKFPCNPQHYVYLLGMELNGQELLAVSCRDCQEIKLLNLDTQHVTSAYGETKVGIMCHGDTNRLFVELVEGSEVMELDTSSSTFTLVKMIKTGLKFRHRGMCYVPLPHRYLVVSAEDTHKGQIRAVSCETSECVFYVNGPVDVHSNYDRRYIDPVRLLYSPQHGSVLVADCENSRILVLDPCNGDILQTFDLRSMGEIIDLCLYNDQVIMKHNVSSFFFKINVLISIFSSR